MLFMLMWNATATRWGVIGSHTEMEAAAAFASESLMATRGFPVSWEALPHIDGNVSAIGLANGRNELSRAKLEKLVSENATAYGTVRARLGLQKYSFGMRVSDISDNIALYEFGEFSPAPTGDSLSFVRLGVLDGEPVIVHMEVWEP
ncbi:MAG: hypothetical protein AB1324_06850 [Candidatus Micrarchaeota archaeon]